MIKVEDLVTWITADAEWTWGKLTIYESDVKSPEGEQSTGGGGGINTPLTISSLTESSLDFSDVEKERKLLGRLNFLLIEIFHTFYSFFNHQIICFN